jgi:hypothetical protein
MHASRSEGKSGHLPGCEQMRYQSGKERVSFGVEPAPRVAACAEPLSFGQLFARQLRDRLLLALTRPVQTIADERAWRGFLLMSTVQTLGEEQSGRRADFGESRGQPAAPLPKH